MVGCVRSLGFALPEPVTFLEHLMLVTPWPSCTNPETVQHSQGYVNPDPLWQDWQGARAPPLKRVN